MGHRPDSDKNGAMKDGDEAFGELVANISDTPWMNREQGRLIWEHFRTHRPQAALDIGTCYGTSAAYMAGAMKFFGGGSVVTVDSGLFDDLDFDVRAACTSLWERCGVADMIQMVRIPHSNYAWWLLDQVTEQTSTVDGSVTPVFDFAYLDGAKWFTLDASSVVLVNMLLRAGGWLLMDDLEWSYADHPEIMPDVVLPNGTSYSLSDGEIMRPHLRAVFDHVVRNLPEFSTFVDQGDWGWAEKGAATDRRVVVKQEWTLPPGVSRAQWVRRRAQALLRGRSTR